jgi:uncharacterized phiE125 gp8 family phage protein
MTYIDGITILADAVVEPVSLTDAKNWMRITNYDTDDVMIVDLLSAARVHIEKLTNCSLVNKSVRINVELTPQSQGFWILDVPYGPLGCVDEVKIKTGMNTYEVLTKNTDFEVIGGKIWIYTAGIYVIKYQCGFSTIPEDLATDILTLTAWSYENRGKKMNNDPRNRMTEFPSWDGLNYHQYKKVVI